jgi:hypothetical protein
MHVKYAASEQGAAAALMLCPEEEEKNQRGKEGGFLPAPLQGTAALASE